MKKIIDSLKYLKIKDFLSIFILIIIIPFAMICKLYYRITNKRVWLVCEEGISARDNGYFFFKYVREKHPEVDCYFVIDKKSNDYQNVKKMGNIVQYKSLKHWIMYLSCEYNIVSQKKGNPNQPLFYFLHVILNMFNNRVYLKHGIVKDKCEWLFYKNTKYKYFICGAKNEYEYVKKIYGYPENSVVYTGLARYDSLYEYNKDMKTILFMPTWRNWLGRETNFLGEKVEFRNTEFYKFWNDLLNDDELNKWINDEKIELLFYPHINMQKFLNDFKCDNNRIKFLDTSESIQEILKKASVLVTDYSSVFMDFAYMKKPIVFFQFDYEEFRKRQYTEGYFNYERDGFGPICTEPKKVVDEIKRIYYNRNMADEKYLKRMDNFFELHDQKNCERIFTILNLSSKEKKNENTNH